MDRSLMKINNHEIYESLRISTIFSGHSFVTTPETLSWNDKQDDAFFATHPKRRYLVRKSNSGEFDAPLVRAHNVSLPNYRILPPISKVLEAVYEKIPPLWTLVCRMDSKRHVLTAVYRGSAFFQTTEHAGRIIANSGDDLEVAVLLQVMQMRRGMDGEEWGAFEQRYRQALAGFTTSINATRVH
jgi:hypothetical protein